MIHPTGVGVGEVDSSRKVLSSMEGAASFSLAAG